MQETDRDALAYRIFAVLWAIAIIFHIMAFSKSLSLVNGMQVILAFVIIARPSFLAAFIGMIVLQLVMTYDQLPLGSNHQLFTSCVNLTILVSLATLMIARRRLHIRAAELYQVFAPLARVELLILYFFVVFHKLNTGFFNLEISCAAEMFMNLRTNFIFLPSDDWARISAIYFTILIEAAIPILLFLRRFRFAGILLGVAFHFMLAFEPKNVFFNFSSMLYAMYVLFLPDDFGAAILQTLQPLRQFWESLGRRRWTLITSRALVYVALPVAVFALTFRTDLGLDNLTHEHARFVWIMLAIGLAVSLMVALRHYQPSSPAQPMLRVCYPALALLPLLVFLNGFSPYLGLKTELSFAMFSNLYTEGNQTNHLLVPLSIQVFDYQRDLVRVIDADGELDNEINNERLYPSIQFRQLAQMYPWTNLTYEVDGEQVTLETNRDDPTLLEPIPLLQQKFFAFRRIYVSPDRWATCRH